MRDGRLPWFDDESHARWVLLAASVLVLFAGLGAYRPLTTHEVYVAQTAREMLATGDWITPHCFGEARLKKPPLAYWQTAAAFRIFGAHDWSARLPSALAGLGQSLLIFWFAKRSFDVQIGFLAGFFQVASVATLTQARLAEADMTLAFWVAAALIAFAVGQIERHSPGVGASQFPVLRVWCFWMATAMAILAKGPVALLFIAGVIVATCIGLRTIQPWRNLLRPIPFALAATLVFAWPVALLNQHPDALQIWRAETLDRFAHDPNGVVRIPGYYLVAAIWLTLPWTMLWLIELPGLFRQPRTAFGVFLAGWIIVPIGLLSLSGGKQEHYLIPALPPLAICAAFGFRRVERWLANRRFQPNFLWVRATINGTALAALIVAGIVAVEILLLPCMHNRRQEADWMQRATVEGLGNEMMAVVGHSVQWLGFYGPINITRFDCAETFSTCALKPRFALTTTEIAPRLAGYRVFQRCSNRRDAGPALESPKMPVLLERCNAPAPAIQFVRSPSVNRLSR